MKLYAPEYYRDFHCIAGDCRHSCCIGWEIDIDPATYAVYQSCTGALGDRLQRSIRQDGDGASFILGEGERCPFLNPDGLCELILAGGEGMLCEICSEHPRFYNFWSDRCEVGLGLCCEAAGRLILSGEQSVRLIPIGELEEEERQSEDEETGLLQTRDALLALAQDRSLSLGDRFARIETVAGMRLPQKSAAAWAEIYRGLERLSPVWDDWLDRWEQSGILWMPEQADQPVLCENLLHYFLYRHIAKGYEDGQYAERAIFALLSVTVICSLLMVCRETGVPTLADWVEIARLYSSEIEYSEENMQLLFDLLSGR